MSYLQIHICVSGFTQTRGYYHGILKLRENLIADGHNCDTQQRVWYLPWTTNWKHLAADLALVCTRHGLVPVVTVSGYSYGGYGAIQFCKELERRGVFVEVLTLSDPVGRSAWWPRPLPAASSMLGRKWSYKLVVPDNVRLVNEFHQTTDRPQGHRLVLGPATTRGVEHKVIQVGHQRMDDLGEFHECVRWHANDIATRIKDGEQLCGDQP